MIKGSPLSLNALLARLMTLQLSAALMAHTQQPATPTNSLKDLSQSRDAVGGPDPKPAISLQDGTSNDRLLYALPDFLTVEATQLPPLSTGQKFKVVARISFDPVVYPWYAALAGFSQAENSERGFGQGAAGYGKRYGTAFADATLENFMTGAILPSLLREDPRYYQLGKGTFRRRTAYAISRIVVTRTDSGNERFNYSEIFGSAFSAGISTYGYHPQTDRNLPTAASVWGSLVGYDTLTIVFTEFWPDIRRRLGHKR